MPLLSDLTNSHVIQLKIGSSIHGFFAQVTLMRGNVAEYARI